jgi:hypothetical protein
MDVACVQLAIIRCRDCAADEPSNGSQEVPAEPDGIVREVAQDDRVRVEELQCRQRLERPEIVEQKRKISSSSLCAVTDTIVDWDGEDREGKGRQRSGL